MFYYKYQKLFSIILTVLFIAAIYFISSFPKEYIYYLWFAAWLAVLIVILRIRDTTPKKLKKIWETECNSELFAKITQAVAGSPFAYAEIRMRFKLYQINALLDLREFEEAYKELNNCNLDQFRKKNITFELQYYVLLLAYYAHTDNIGEALRACSQIKSISDECQDNKAINLYAQKILKDAEARMSFIKGDYDSCKSYYLSEYKNLKLSVRSNVILAYRLGLIYLNEDPARAKAFFRYVISHGNKMQLVQGANEQLQKISDIPETVNAGSNTLQESHQQMDGYQEEPSQTISDIQEAVSDKTNSLQENNKKEEYHEVPRDERTIPQLQSIQCTPRYKIKRSHPGAKKAWIIIASITAVIVLFAIIGGFISDMSQKASLEAQGFIPGTPEYSIKKSNLHVEGGNGQYNYAIAGNYMFLLQNGSFQIDVWPKNSSGNYAWNIITPMILSNDQDYIRDAQGMKKDGKTILVFNANLHSAGMESMLSARAETVDNSKLEMVDSNGNKLGKLSLNGYDFVGFYDVLDQMSEDMKFYAVYNGSQYLITDGQDINQELNAFAKG